LGLDDLDRRYLRVVIDIYEGGPVGIEAIAATIGEESDTLMDMVEPFLLKIGFLARTRSGRKVTQAAWQHLGIDPPRGSNQNLLFR
ncbi:MAG: Holliday junction DNA helicase RuvB C-terminal domain-containing protein, partial [Planctomycetota bacterium]